MLIWLLLGFTTTSQCVGSSGVLTQDGDLEEEDAEDEAQVGVDRSYQPFVRSARVWWL